MKSRTVPIFERWIAKLLPGGIQARLFLLIALGLLPLSLLLGWIYHERYQVRQAEALQTELEVAQGIATSFSTFIDGIRRQSHAIGECILIFSPYTRVKATHVLETAVAEYPAVRNMSWVSPGGKVLASTLPALVGRDLSSRTYFQEVAAGRPWALGDLTPTGAAVNAPTVALATAVRDEGGALRGMVVAGIEPKRLGGVILVRQRPAGGVYAIFDRKGAVVYHSKASLAWEERVRWRQSDSLLRRALETGEPQAGVSRLAVPGGEWMSARVPVPEIGWVAGAGRPVETALAPVRKSLFKDISLAMVITSLGFLAAYFLALTIARPLRRLERETQAMGAGVMTGEEGLQAPTEVRHLRTSVAAMANDLLRQAEALREREARLMLFVEHAPAALAMFDREMRYITASQRWRSDFGLGERDIRGLSHYEVFPEIPERWKQIHRRGLAGEVLRADEDRFERADGSVQWLRWEIRPWRDAAGSVAGILIFTEEITRRKAVEEAMRESEERLRQGVRVARIGIFEHDHRTDAIHLSPEMREILGWKAEGPATLPALAERVHPEDRQRVLEAIERAHDPAGDGMYSVEHRIVLDDGSVRHVSIRSRTFFEGEGEARRPLRTVGAAVDITERTRMEEDLRSAKEAAEEASRVKSEFLANMSHELRTPLTVIMTSLEMVRDPALAGGDSAPFLEMIDDSAHKLLGIIDDLLDITRIEAGRLKLVEREFDLRECVRRAAEPCAAAAREKGLRFRCEVAPQVAPRVIGDPDRVGQVIENLAGNAVKFTGRGEVTLTAAESPDGVVFTIRDTGIGIPADKLGQLFHPFTQVDSSLTRRHGGTGLGLAISRELVERMGGTIRVESEQGRGSTFTVTLPLRPSVPAGQIPSGKAEPREGGRPARILLAEDDSSIRRLIETLLRRRGWEAVSAENGRQAVERWKEGGIDLVLMDLQMPEMDGLAATRSIRALEGNGDPRTPILALTAHAQPRDREECLEAGMDGFLSKPIHSAELYSAVESCLSGACAEARTGENP